MTQFLSTSYTIAWIILTLYVLSNFARDWKRRKDAEHDLERKEWLEELRRRVAIADEQAKREG